MKIRTDALRAERLALGLTQEALAHRAGVSRSAVQYAERGEPKSPPAIRKLSDALGCTVADIAEAETDAEAAALARRLNEAEAS